MSNFLFVGGLDDLRAHNSLVVELPSAIRTRDEMFDALGRLLAFPTSTGRNWDAVEDRLTDLSWIPHRKIVLYHPGVPMKDSPRDLRIYLDILAEAVDDWSQSGEKEFIVAFPSTSEARLGRYERRRSS